MQIEIYMDMKSIFIVHLNNTNSTVMKRLILVVLALVLISDVSFTAPRVKIVNNATNPEMIKTIPGLIPDSCVASGLVAVGRGQYVYLSAFNFGDTGRITSQTWTFVSRPTGSNAVLTAVPGLNWYKFKADSTGTYEVRVSITASTGTKDTTEKFYAAKYVGFGKFTGSAAFPQCMSCHGGMPAFTEIFNRWKVSGHANIFRRQIDSGAAYYSTACMKCHTTGYDHNLVANNNGFDDVARTLGWVWSPPPAPGKWNNLVTNFPGLEPFAAIGCENCHGAGSEHTRLGGDTNMIAVNYTSNSCSNCHGEPWRHSIYQQWENSTHSESVFEGRTVALTSRNTLSDCNRCHDGESHVDYTKNRIGTLNLTTADQVKLGCPTCHDPHGNTNEASLRNNPAGSDTLSNGVSYAFTGSGKACITCHQARRNNKTYIVARGSFTSTWGPHESVQGDVVIGTNAAEFGSPYITGSHRNIEGACVGCHMYPTPDTGNVLRDKVGGHTMKLHDEASNTDYVKPCQSCHPGVTNFEQFISPADFDGDGNRESWRAEVDGCVRNLRIALPPTGVDSVAWQLIAQDSNNVTLRKAYWNYLLAIREASRGLHNPFFEVQFLLASKNAIVGINQTSTEVPETFTMSQNYPNPFNPTTKVDFAIPKTSSVTLVIYDISGREIKSLIRNQTMLAGKYTVDWNSTDNSGTGVSSGVYFYRIISDGQVITKKMMLVK